MSAAIEACFTRHVALLSPPLPVPSPPLPFPSPLTTSPTNTGAPLGYRAVGIRMRALLPSTSHRTDIHKADVPPRKRACLTTVAPRFKVGESFAAGAARSAVITAHIKTLEAYVAALIAQTSSLQTQLTTALGRIEILKARDLEPQEGPAEAGSSCTKRVVGLTRWLEKMESIFQINNCTVTCQIKFASFTLQGSSLTWWNSHMRAVRQDVPYAMPWAALKRMITDKYCLRECSPEESAKEAIEFATKMMDKKMLTHAKHQTEHKRKFDDTLRNNQHQQQPFKRNNVARAYTAGPGDKKPYGGTKPLCPKCNYHHDGPCAPKCTNCKKIGHLVRDCKGRPAATNNNNNNNTNNNNQRAQGENARGITCFKCGVQGHYKSDCPKLKNGNQWNRARNGNVVAIVYAVGTARTNPNSNVVTGSEDFVVYCDALIKGLGAVLMQREKQASERARSHTYQTPSNVADPENKKKQCMIFKVDFEKAQCNIDTIIRVLDVFYRASGLRINMNKSNLIGISVASNKVKHVAAKIGDSKYGIYLCVFFNGADVNSKKPSWVRWKSVLAAKDVGGLGVVVKALHGEDGRIGKKVQPRYPSTWLNIINEIASLKLHGIDLVSFITPKLGNGVNTSFWDVAWCGDIVFKNLVPRLYALESMKNIKVASKLSHGGLEFSFRRNSRGGVEQAQFERLKEMVKGLTLSNSND
nr:RNA-directed DNA polymerase, eukaryota, reverse transcriptase zinc-binding domain protein [Tanacetum cinerariifolium]